MFLTLLSGLQTCPSAAPLGLHSHFCHLLTFLLLLCIVCLFASRDHSVSFLEAKTSFYGLLHPQRLQPGHYSINSYGMNQSMQEGEREEGCIATMY